MAIKYEIIENYENELDNKVQDMIEYYLDEMMHQLNKHYHEDDWVIHFDDCIYPKNVLLNDEFSPNNRMIRIIGDFIIIQKEYYNRFCIRLNELLRSYSIGIVEHQDNSSIFNIKLNASLKDIKNAYYMEMQRIQYPSSKKDEKKQSLPNYYKKFAEKESVSHDVLDSYNTFIDLEVVSIFEKSILEKILPRIIENKLDNYIPNGNKHAMILENVKSSFNIVCSDNLNDDFLINLPNIYINKRYYKSFLNYIENFILYNTIGDYIINDCSTTIKINCSLETLVDAYYMEIQRLEYLNGDSLKRNK